MSGIEQAATAFDQALGNGAEVADEKVSQIAFESLFPTRQHENDEIAGGDDEPAPQPRVQRAPLLRVERNDARRAVEGEQDEDELFYGTDDTEDAEVGATEDIDEGDEDTETVETYDELPEELAGIKVKIVVDGEEGEVTLAEAVQGYQRTEVFHRRLNKLTTVAKELEDEAGVVVAKRNEAIALIDQLGTQLAEFLPPEPDWDKEFQVDAAKARALQKNYNTLKSKLETLAKKRQELFQKNESDNANRLANFIQTEKQKVLDANPHWSDPKKMERDLASMTRTLKTLGFAEEEIKQLYDSRMIAAVLKASKYDRMTAKRPVPSPRGKAPIAKSGAGRVRTAPKNLQRSQQQLSRTGRVEDAAAVFSQILNT